MKEEKKCNCQYEKDNGHSFECPMYVERPFPSVERKEIRQIEEGKWNTIPKEGIRVTCCDCGAKHTAEFKWFGKILKYRAFKCKNWKDYPETDIKVGETYYPPENVSEPKESKEDTCICHAHYDSIERRAEGEKIPRAPLDPDCPFHFPPENVSEPKDDSTKTEEYLGWDEKEYLANLYFLIGDRTEHEWTLILGIIQGKIHNIVKETEERCKKEKDYLVEATVAMELDIERQRIIKLIKEKGLHLGYANPILDIINSTH